MYGVGSGITSFPGAAEILGFLSDGTYLDLDDDNTQDVGEPTGAAALGIMAFGAGKIVFAGDTNLWLSFPPRPLPQPLIDNTINWLLNQ